MKRRDFIKNVFLTAGLLSSGKAMASEYREKKSGFVNKKSPNLQDKVKKIDIFTHFINASTLDFLEELSGQRLDLGRAAIKFLPTCGKRRSASSAYGQVRH